MFGSLMRSSDAPSDTAPCFRYRTSLDDLNGKQGPFATHAVDPLGGRLHFGCLASLKDIECGLKNQGESEAGQAFRRFARSKGSDWDSSQSLCCYLHTGGTR